MRFAFLTLWLVLLALPAWGQSSWPASKVAMSSGNTLQEDVDDGTMRSPIRTVVSALPGSPTNLSQTYIVTDGDALDDCSTGSGALLVHCSWDGSAWQSLGGGGGGSGSGDVVGPSGATDNAIARYDTGTGKLIQDSGAILADDGSLTLGGSGAGTITLPNAAGTFDATISTTVTADKDCNVVDGGWDCIGMEYTGGAGLPDVYTFNDLPDSATYRQSSERTIPASNGNIRIGDIDIPWGYSFSCGPSGSALMDDCTQGYYWNQDGISTSDRINEFLPSFSSQRIENSFIASTTGGNLYYEQNEQINYPLIDVTIEPSGGAWGVDNYLIIGDIWGGGTESWAKILTVNGSALRLSFQGTLVSPANLDTVTEVDNMTDRIDSGVTGTWPASWTEVDISFRTKQQEFSMTGDPSFWSWRVPTDMTAADLGSTTLLKIGSQSGKNGVSITSTSPIADGLTVGGKISIEENAAFAAPCDTYGCLSLKNDNTNKASILIASDHNATQNVRLPGAQGGDHTLAALPRYSIGGIAYLLSEGGPGSRENGDEMCDSVVKLSECATVICMDASHVGDVEACADDLDTQGHNNHWVMVSCYEDD